jgi:hypothetical protein
MKGKGCGPHILVKNSPHLSLTCSLPCWNKTSRLITGRCTLLATGWCRVYKNEVPLSANHWSTFCTQNSHCWRMQHELSNLYVNRPSKLSSQPINYTYTLSKYSKANPLRHANDKVERRYSSYSLSTSALDGGEWSVSRPGHAFTPGERTPGTHCTGGWVGPRADLDTEARGKILCARSQTLYWATPAPKYGAKLVLKHRTIKKNGARKQGSMHTFHCTWQGSCSL